MGEESGDDDCVHDKEAGEDGGDDGGVFDTFLYMEERREKEKRLQPARITKAGKRDCGKLRRARVARVSRVISLDKRLAYITGNH